MNSEKIIRAIPTVKIVKFIVNKFHSMMRSSMIVSFSYKHV